MANQDQQTIVFRFEVDDSGVPIPAKRTEDGLKRVGQAAEQGGKGLLKFGADGKASAAQLQALSYQTTDIITQLAGGQSPLLILLQQGGQLRDQFGGVGNVFRAVAASVTPAAVGIGALAAGVGLFALAAYQGYTEADKLTKQLALTGQAAGVTRGQIDAMAQGLADSTGAPIGALRESLAGLAATGTFMGDNLQLAGRAVVALQRLSGQSSEAIVQQFAGMRNGVAQWVATANQSYNAFTVEQYKTIRALEAQGRTQEAVRLALLGMATTMETRATPALGYLEEAIKGVKAAGSGFWDWLMGVGRPETPEQVLEGARAEVARLEQRLKDAQTSDVKQAGLGLVQSELNAARQRVAFAAETVRTTQRSAEAGAASKAKTDREILEASSGFQSALLGVEQAGMAKRMAEWTRGNQAQRLQSEQDYRTGLITAREHGDNLAELELQKITFEELSVRKSIELAQRRPAGNPQEELGRRQAVLSAEAQLQAALTRREALEARILAGEFKQAELETGRDAFRRSEIQQRNADEAEFAKWQADQRDAAVALTESTRDYGFVLREIQAARALNNDRDLGGSRLGSVARDQAARRAAIDDEVNAARIRLDEELRGKRITEQAYADRRRMLRDYHVQALDDEQRFQDERGRREADGSVGFDRALQDYLDSSRNVAAQTERAWSGAFNGLEDGLVRFVETGKLRFGDLARSVIADLLRIQIRAQLAGLFGQLGGMLGFGGSGGGFGAVNGSAGTPIIPPTLAAKGMASDGWSVFGAGGVVDRPTPFRFAQGGTMRNGLMGEAGPEAILPLRRGTDGALGVAVTGGGGGGNAVQVALGLHVINNTGTAAKATATQRGNGDIELLLEAVDQGMADRVSSGRGATTYALQQRFGLRAVLG